MGTLLIRPPGHRRDVALRPAATAMVWIGEGHAHETIAVPGVALGDHDALVAVEMSTVCASDVRTVLGQAPSPTPLVLGHESVGRVIAIGDAGVTAVDGGPLRIGDRVVWSATVSCDACDRCLAGLTQKCRTLGAYGRDRIGIHGDLTGAFSTHMQLRAGTRIVRVPESLPAAVLSPASCATATAWAAVSRAARDHDLDGAVVRIYGAGLVGLSAAAIAVEQGALVEMVDPDPVRLAWASRFGARHHRVEHDLDSPDASTGADVAPVVVIETSGCAAAKAIDSVAAGGIVVLAGEYLPASVLGLDAESLVSRLVTVVGLRGCTGADLVEAVAFLAGRGRAYPFAEAVGDVRSLAEIDEAIAAASAPGAPLRIGLVPGR